VRAAARIIERAAGHWLTADAGCFGMPGYGMTQPNPSESLEAQVRAKIGSTLRQSALGLRIAGGGKVLDASVTERIALLFQLSMALRDIAIETAAEVDSLRAAVAELRRED
jgi:hypothetical protein